MKSIFDYKFRFYTSKLNEICLQCHLLYFSSIILSFGQCVLAKNSKYTNWTLKARELFFCTEPKFPDHEDRMFCKVPFSTLFHSFMVLYICKKNAAELLVHFGQRDNFWSHRVYFITKLVKSTKRKWVVTLYSIMYMICTFIFWR